MGSGPAERVGAVFVNDEPPDSEDTGAGDPSDHSRCPGHTGQTPGRQAPHGPHRARPEPGARGAVPPPTSRLRPHHGNTGPNRPPYRPRRVRRRCAGSRHRPRQTPRQAATPDHSHCDPSTPPRLCLVFRRHEQCPQLATQTRPRAATHGHQNWNPNRRRYPCLAVRRYDSTQRPRKIRPQAANPSRRQSPSMPGYPHPLAPRSHVGVQHQAQQKCPRARESGHLCDGDPNRLWHPCLAIRSRVPPLC